MSDQHSDNQASLKLVLTGPGINIEREVDGAAAVEIMRIALDDPSEGPLQSPAPKPEGPREGTRTARSTSRKKAKRKASPGLVRDLSLRPAAKTSLADFAAEKEPKNHAEKQIVIVYWLTNELGMGSGITLDHVNTCYQGLDWKRPANLENILQKTASIKGWLDTRDMSNITITVSGEDTVKYDLPKSENS